MGNNDATCETAMDAYDASRISHSHQLFFDKVARKKLTYNCLVTISFSASTEWKDNRRTSDSIEFGFMEADLVVELKNGTMYMRHGDKLGAKIQLGYEQTTSRTSTSEKSSTGESRIKGSAEKKFGVEAELKASAGQKAGQEDRTEKTFWRALVSSNLSLADKPMWTFRGADEPLDGQLANQDLMTVITKSTGLVDFNSWIQVRSEHVVIHRMPDSWPVKIRFKALREETLRKKISTLISHHSNKVRDVSLEPS